MTKRSVAATRWSPPQMAIRSAQRHQHRLEPDVEQDQVAGQNSSISADYEQQESDR